MRGLRGEDGRGLQLRLQALREAQAGRGQEEGQGREGGQPVRFVSVCFVCGPLVAFLAGVGVIGLT